MLLKVSPVRTDGSENDEIISRMTRAQDRTPGEGWWAFFHQETGQSALSKDLPLDAMLKRGRARRVPRCRTLDEQDGNWN